MRKLVLILFTAGVFPGCHPPSQTSQTTGQVTGINQGDVIRVQNLLSSDEMKGRKTFTPEIDLAAGVIAEEFRAAGLKTFDPSGTFLQSFSLVKARQVSVKGTVDGNELGSAEMTVFTSSPKVRISDVDAYEMVYISAAESLQSKAREYTRSNKNLLVYIDRKHATSFGNLSRLKSNFFKSDKNVVFVLSDSRPQRWSVEAEHEITEQRLSNVVGIIPGKSKSNEYVIFSAHYDHIGVGRPVEGDSIFNGANDDASGTTAVTVLARHFMKQGTPERTLVFAAFTAEEIGGYGSQYFSRQLDPGAVVAMFNIEMIGTESKWGKNAAFITGYEKSDLGSIMQKNLQGSAFTFYPDPYPQQQLFYRSDNATLARLGVPAHTISTAKMESEPHYHRVSDEIETLDLENMTKIIEAIALSAGSVVMGKDTPSRVALSGF